MQASDIFKRDQRTPNPPDVLLTLPNPIKLTLAAVSNLGMCVYKCILTSAPNPLLILTLTLTLSPLPNPHPTATPSLLIS